MCPHTDGEIAQQSWPMLSMQLSLGACGPEPSRPECGLLNGKEKSLESQPHFIPHYLHFRVFPKAKVNGQKF